VRCSVARCEPAIVWHALLLVVLAWNLSGCDTAPAPLEPRAENAAVNDNRSIEGCAAVSARAALHADGDDVSPFEIHRLNPLATIAIEGAWPMRAGLLEVPSSSETPI
jgi:hypothetical protein